MIQAKVKYTFRTALQFDVETGGGHHFLVMTPREKPVRSPLSSWLPLWAAAPLLM